MKKNGSLVFIVLALGITWVLWIPALMLVSAKGYPLPTIDYLLNHRSFAIVNSEHGLAVVLFSLAVYGPLLAGLIVTLMEGGRKRAAEWFAPVLRWKFKPYWLGMVLLIALAVSLLPMLVGTLTGLVTLRPDGIFPPVLLILGLFLYQLLTSGLGEEPGWRAYLLPRLQADHGTRESSMVVRAGLGSVALPFHDLLHFARRAGPAACSAACADCPVTSGADDVADRDGVYLFLADQRHAERVDRHHFPCAGKYAEFGGRSDGSG